MSNTHHSSQVQAQPRDPKIFVVNEGDPDMFSKEIEEQEKTPRVETANPPSEDIIKKTDESPINLEHDRLTTTMAKEEIGNQLSSLQEEVKQAKMY